MRRPPWLLAIVVVVALASVVVVILEGHEDNVGQVMEVVVPVVAALFVVDRVDARSDAQDEKLRANHEVITSVHDQVNGNLTQRLDDAVAPLRAEIAQLREQITLDPDQATDTTGQAYAEKRED